MAGRSWARHFGGDRPPTPPSPPPEPPRVGLGGVLDFVRHWQVVVAVIAGTATLVFSCSDHEQKQLEINQKASAFVRQPEMIKRFWTDPRNMINEIEPLFPRRAFCSALGFYLSEWTLAEITVARGASGGTAWYSIDSVKLSGEAVKEAMRGVGADAGLGMDALRLGAERVGLANQDCLALDVAPDWLARQRTPHECLLLLDAFVENVCLGTREQTRVGRQAQLAAGAKIGEGAVQPATTAAPPPDPEPATAAPDPAPEPPADHEPATAAPDPAPDPAPQPAPAAPAACAPVGPMLVYVQFLDPADLAWAQTTMTALAARGWDLAGPERIAGQSVSGDVRHYYANQAACAQALADDVAAVAGPDRAAMQVISLEGRYTDLPIRRLELWLPGRAGAQGDDRREAAPTLDRR